ncbi:hypothetical protein ACFYSF_13120 [Streptomyces canus]|uniref:hypothetical protein n=1 Tax=Streptomyces canus TaxID=58343 RepID=UPI0036B59BB5
MTTSLQPDDASGSSWLGKPIDARPPFGPETASLLDPETARRLLTRGIDPGTALARVHISGERQVVEAACQIVSIVY